MTEAVIGKKLSPKPQTKAPPSPPPQGSMLEEAAATQMLRQSWTRERATFLSRVAILSMGLNAIMVVVIGFLAIRPIDHLYFWTNSDGTIHPLVALSEPVLSASERSLWVTQTITSALSMDFTNFRAQLQSSRANFTSEGHDGFLKALQSSGIMASIIQYKYIMSAVPKAAPLLVAGERLPDGRFAWQYELPVLLTFQASDKTNAQEMTLQIVVVRVKETENPKGMAIARFQAK